MYYYALPLLIVLIVLLLLIVLIVLFPGEGASPLPRPHPRFILQCNVELFHRAVRIRLYSCTTILHTSRTSENMICSRALLKVVLLRF